MKALSITMPGLILELKYTRGEMVLELVFWVISNGIIRWPFEIGVQQTGRQLIRPVLRPVRDRLP
jgi:hypothetical protein